MPRMTAMAAISISMVVGYASGCAAQTFPSDLPLAIVCYHEQKQSWVVGYLEIVNADGSAVYGRGTLTANLGVERVVEPPRNRVVALDCYGKSLEQLRATGRLVELRPGQ